ncbi:2Fe-2S iron-sulfur cluster-binding protein [Sorangium sp. So ce381]|uniref:2Fe-2S iron-sulfur cluster-binding protein n=1 Tax=Sorangium sp. So ce381 TaxID=3133307 RepID=UPI003F5AE62F
MVSVVLIRSGSECVVTMPPGTRLADACLQRKPSPLPLGCRKGGCGTCLVRVVEGAPGPRTEREDDFFRRTAFDRPELRLGCQLWPHRSLVLEAVISRKEVL